MDSKEDDTKSWERYLPYMQELAERIVRRSPGTSLDPSSLAQTAIIEAWRCRTRFRGEGEEVFLAWMRGILANIVRSASRDHKKSLEQNASLIDENGTKYGSAFISDPFAVLQEQEFSELVWRTIDELSEDYRLVLLMRHREGLGFREIAVQLERSESATRMIWVRALRELRRILPNGKDEPF